MEAALVEDWARDRAGAARLDYSRLSSAALTLTLTLTLTKARLLAPILRGPNPNLALTVAPIPTPSPPALILPYQIQGSTTRAYSLRSSSSLTTGPPASAPSSTRRCSTYPYPLPTPSPNPNPNL